MFNKKTEIIDNSKLIQEYEFKIQTIKQDNDLLVKKLKAEQEIELLEKAFEMKNFKDTEILDKNKEIETLTNKNAVLVKENEMMNKMVDINADIVDVKDIINQLTFLFTLAVALKSSTRGFSFSISVFYKPQLALQIP